VEIVSRLNLKPKISNVSLFFSVLNSILSQSLSFPTKFHRYLPLSSIAKNRGQEERFQHLSYDSNLLNNPFLIKDEVSSQFTF